MYLFEILLIAIGLSMDAFAVSIANGISIKYLTKKDGLKIAFAFGLFQALMPIIGWAIGSSFKNAISSYDHWVAFLLLFLIGVKMIYESFKYEEAEKDQKLTGKLLFFQAVATSIDALIIGTSFAFLEFPILPSVSIIGITTFLFSLVGVFIGKKSGPSLGKRAELIGGLILIVIGAKILLEHLIFI